MDTTQHVHSAKMPREVVSIGWPAKTGEFLDPRQDLNMIAGHVYIHNVHSNSFIDFVKRSTA